MADIRFYHLEHSTLDKALPAITMKAWQSGKRVAIRVPDKKEAARLDDLLWTFHPDVFLPHGMAGDKNDARQPVLLNSGQGNENDAEILILTHGCTENDLSPYGMVCEMLDGRVESQITEARQRWKAYKDSGHDLTYWQQDQNGKWNKRG